ncbi:hypothetical protein J7F01_08895 [Streptomyces sp. ISL-22]|uniref:hypothetical protein n=1 Tax=unclassified Streptomyces TaxID=2593676 RepID=UPI001BE6F825|nr:MULTISPECIES: hypothetical protein [unclassified Streptomyces]MBT2418006.1 hypothetical protein [Streptomyces sp. ISL-24]MBT2432319.1 hypothetical protein [Streptomyces sp. ISL-22]
MTSRHNERLMARRAVLREQHKRELEEAKRRQAAQLAVITDFDQRVARLEAAELDVAKAVAKAVDVFGGRKEAADALGLTGAQVRDYMTRQAEHDADTDETARNEDTAEAPEAHPQRTENEPSSLPVGY